MVGPSLDQGPLPAIFYFALSAKDSLETDPYNQPVVHIKEKRMRIFSLDLPFHKENDSPLTALQFWGKALEHSDRLILEFIQEIQETIHVLSQKNLLIPGKIGAMGLSRGGFIATHAAARIPDIGFVVGFAPLTKISCGKDFTKSPFTTALDLEHLVDQLVGKPLQFYIGNLDARVGTRFCFEFIEALTVASHTKHIRSPQVHLCLFPSIGHQGHGTPPHIFCEGASWLAGKLHG